MGKQYRKVLSTVLIKIFLKIDINPKTPIEYINKSTIINITKQNRTYLFYEYREYR